MSANKPHYSTEVARNHLLTSLNALASDDCAKCSQHLWLAARQAAVVVAKRRDWPADTDHDVEDAIRRLDTEHGDQFEILSEFNTAEMFRNNADHGFLDKDEIIWFQPIVHEFVERMLALHPTEDGKLDADRTGTRR